jgi:hypothetical protein
MNLKHTVALTGGCKRPGIAKSKYSAVIIACSGSNQVGLLVGMRSYKALEHTEI